MSLAHAEATGRVVSAMDPRYLSLLTLMLVPGTPLDEQWRQGAFQLLEPEALLGELRHVILHLEGLSGCILTGVRRAGLFGRAQTHTYYDAAPWEGYCSGFTAATIRHPEPMRPVDAGTVGGRPGVVFQPAEIKTLLSAAYNRTRRDSFLLVAPPSARDGGPNMGTLHLALANYIGQAGHPVGIDRVKGREAWNNPIYKYEVTSTRDAGRQGDLEYRELVTKITYTWYGTDQVSQTNPDTGERQGHQSRSLSVRYQLQLDAEGKIVGGRALSHAGHFLWIPFFAVQGVPDQSSPGNPHLDVQKIIALARRSALPEIQAKYDRLVIGTMIDPQIALRAEAQRLREVSAQAEAAGRLGGEATGN